MSYCNVLIMNIVQFVFLDVISEKSHQSHLLKAMRFILNPTYLNLSTHWLASSPYANYFQKLFLMRVISRFSYTTYTIHYGKRHNLHYTKIRKSMHISSHRSHIQIFGENRNIENSRIFLHRVFSMTDQKRVMSFKMRKLVNLLHDDNICNFAL